MSTRRIPAGILKNGARNALSKREKDRLWLHSFHAIALLRGGKNMLCRHMKYDSCRAEFGSSTRKPESPQERQHFHP